MPTTLSAGEYTHGFGVTHQGAKSVGVFPRRKRGGQGDDGWRRALHPGKTHGVGIAELDPHLLHPLPICYVFRQAHGHRLGQVGDAASAQGQQSVGALPPGLLRRLQHMGTWHVLTAASKGPHPPSAHDSLDFSDQGGLANQAGRGQEQPPVAQSIQLIIERSQTPPTEHHPIDGKDVIAAGLVRHERLP